MGSHWLALAAFPTYFHDDPLTVTVLTPKSQHVFTLSPTLLTWLGDFILRRLQWTSSYMVQLDPMLVI